MGKGANVVGMEESDKWFETFVNPAIVKLTIWRSLGPNCRSRKFWVQDVYDGTWGIRV
jgi:hypothetical protein